MEMSIKRVLCRILCNGWMLMLRLDTHTILLGISTITLNQEARIFAMVLNPEARMFMHAMATALASMFFHPGGFLQIIATTRLGQIILIIARSCQ